MYKGEPIKGIDFYNLLFKSHEFLIELGKVTLASQKLEAELFILLKRGGVQIVQEKPTLGTLIGLGTKNQLFTQSLSEALREICSKRNYLTHNVYALFSEQIDETIFERDNLLDTDVTLYIERASQLHWDLMGFAEIISDMGKT